ncbi:hypothetical protein [Streptantibioticus ferralitis]|uniref:Uncharacterized protein n=1 Tax=Streptantibioticus ferralitis TaxID=236510 RepID=A0ABT5ZBT4_9ACTN|nr:hypothetical protein [Streptantibioticus ferralitis]MDF2261016.1 hypothetical protein [Streptantibioticus ferralitis]
MAISRQHKDNHLLYADAVGSRGKSGVWFGEREAFQTHQSVVMEKLKDNIDWVTLDGAIMAVSIDPPGIVVMAPNPSLPGIIVLADGATPENSEVLKSRYTEKVAEVISGLGLSIEGQEEAAQG